LNDGGEYVTEEELCEEPSFNGLLTAMPTDGNSCRTNGKEIVNVQFEGKENPDIEIKFSP